METLHIKNVDELHMVAQKVIVMLQGCRVESRASVLALQGDLGAGKTAFTKILARELNVTAEVNSPTFVIMKRYEIEQDSQMTQPFSHLVHIDAYRVDAVDEMRPLRFHEVLQEENTLVCIEWAERIQQLLPPHTLYMDIAIGDQESRSITLR